MDTNEVLVYNDRHEICFKFRRAGIRYAILLVVLAAVCVAAVVWFLTPTALGIGSPNIFSYVGSVVFAGVAGAFLASAWATLAGRGKFLYAGTVLLDDLKEDARIRLGNGEPVTYSPEAIRKMYA